MELIVLKSSVCLLALLLYYKIALEPLSIHKFKRVYLLVTIAIAVIIPFITFVKYVEPTFDNSSFIFDTSTTLPLDTHFKIAEQTNYLSNILWSIYVLGVGLFFIRFCVNLFQIISKIRKHTKVKSKSFINVLMEHLEIPHTFFNFIFLNKNKFENNQIPAEVLLHEQTHAKQKHSLDIIIIEVIQILFWFNPLLYWLKKEIKLNHEFLADQDVINQGIDTKTYQTILLQFSSNQQELAFVNAINYSSIKKRFTLMNTQTPQPTVRLRSLLLLPLLGLLVYSFSSTKELEKEITPDIHFQDEKATNIDKSNIVKQIEATLENNKEIKINYVNQNSSLLVNEIECDGCQLNLTKKGIAELILSTTHKEEITSFKLKIPGVTTSHNKGNTLNDQSRQSLSTIKKGDFIMLFDITSESKKYKSIRIQLVDKDDENYSESPEVKKGEESSIPPPPPVNPNTTPEEKAKQAKVIEKHNKDNKITNGRVYKNPPLPHPAPLKSDKNTGFIDIDGKPHFYVTIKNETKYYNRLGYEIDKKGNKLSNTQTDGSKVVPGQKLTKIYKNGEVVSEFRKTWEDEEIMQTSSIDLIKQDKIATIEAKHNRMLLSREDKKEIIETKRNEMLLDREDKIAMIQAKRNGMLLSREDKKEMIQAKHNKMLLAREDKKTMIEAKHNEMLLARDKKKERLQNYNEARKAL
ncbi:M56 family metallopeptidase [Psychroserpens sp. NJDZ02]|uniref:M56 family metallopeptidase n=1 Tax=Psychroserpens sp. NJDZ02 TaxID=2570561 RepID=UPI0010A82455|nr:M56 family metallopeptidase [Psychroserpens sp. NJDZ02]QCE41542.1 M56 family metallopeptidase [Psychroserpens sp. NJDZ02]